MGVRAPRITVISFNPCFNGLSRRTDSRGHAIPAPHASTLVLMDCPGGLDNMPADNAEGAASTLVLMDCPGGRLSPVSVSAHSELQPLF